MRPVAPDPARLTDEESPPDSISIILLRICGVVSRSLAIKLSLLSNDSLLS